MFSRNKKSKEYSYRESDCRLLPMVYIFSDAATIDSSILRFRIVCITISYRYDLEFTAKYPFTCLDDRAFPFAQFKKSVLVRAYHDNGHILFNIAYIGV